MVEIERFTRFGAFDRKKHVAPGCPHCARRAFAVIFELVARVSQLRLGHLVLQPLVDALSWRGSPPIDSHADARRIASRAVASCVSSAATKRHRWIVDPLDGTTNFLHGIPHFAISIGLERDGEIVAGVIYEPIRDEMYWAEKGAGAYVNDRRLRVSARRQLGEAVIATGMPFGDRADQPTYMATLAAVISATTGVRRMGSAAVRGVGPQRAGEETFAGTRGND